MPAACRTSGSTRPRRCGAIPSCAIDDDVEVVFQEQSGIAAAARANAAHQRLARAHGADLREHARVEAIDTAGDEVAVRVGGRTIRAGQLDRLRRPWTNDALAHFDQRLNLDVTREQVIYLEPSGPGRVRARSASRSGSG